MQNFSSDGQKLLESLLPCITPSAFQKAALNKPGGQLSFIFKRKLLRVSLEWRLGQKMCPSSLQLICRRPWSWVRWWVRVPREQFQGHDSTLLPPLAFLIQPNINLMPGEKQAVIITLNYSPCAKPALFMLREVRAWRGEVFGIRCTLAPPASRLLSQVYTFP